MISCVPKDMFESLVASFLKSLEFIKMHIAMVIHLMNHPLQVMIDHKTMLNMDTMMSMMIVTLISMSL